MKGCEYESLIAVVEDIVLDTQMVHDSYCCSLFNGTRSFPSPRPTDKDYVGRRHNDPGLPADRTCPLECRPPQYPDWNYC